MADPTAFYRGAIGTIQQFLNTVDDLRTISDRMENDVALAGAAAGAASVGGREDLSPTDFNNLKSAIDQILFTLNSGSPPQKQYLYKML